MPRCVGILIPTDVRMTDVDEQSISLCFNKEAIKCDIMASYVAQNECFSGI